MLASVRCADKARDRHSFAAFSDPAPACEAAATTLQPALDEADPTVALT